MSYREHLPPAELAPFVACFWTSAPARASHRVVPDGCMDLLMELDGGARPGVFVVGAMTRPITTGGHGTIVAARFRPGAAASLLGVVARELRDATIPLESLWSSSARLLLDRVGDAPELGARVRALAGALGERARAAEPDPRVTAAVELLRDRAGALDVATVSRAVCLGERQLERAFDRHVGIGPKLFARIARLDLARRTVCGSQRPDWAALAASLGFCDQAHLVREFNDLEGATPGTFARERMSE